MSNETEDEEYSTYEKCLQAVRENAYHLEFIPEKFMTYELCIEAVHHSSDERGYAFSVYIPDKFLTSELHELLRCRRKGYTEVDINYLRREAKLNNF